MKRAYARSLEIIGESVVQIPKEVRQQQPTLNWRAIAGLRDRLIHAYFGVDYEIVWDVIQHQIPDLEIQIRQMLDSTPLAGE